MLAVFLALSAAAQAPEPPAAVPIFCLDSTGVFQPVVDTSYGDLKTAFRRQFGFRSHLVRTTPTSGTLTFYGTGRKPETIRYRVKPYGGDNGAGLAVIDMTVRLRGASDDLHGTSMCFQTFSILHEQQ